MARRKKQDNQARSMPDTAVQHPAHYTQGPIECIDAIRAALGPERFVGFCQGNVIKYVWRYEHKGAAEDLAKAAWYLERLRETELDRRTT